MSVGRLRLGTPHGGQSRVSTRASTRTCTPRDTNLLGVALILRSRILWYHAQNMTLLQLSFSETRIVVP